MTDTTARPELPKTYDPAAVEEPTARRWIERGYFTADPDSDRPKFSMVLPPPNVTGSLHRGHALNHSFQDYLARFHRMRGFDVLWLPGMDHAGIATQNVVERLLASEGRTRFDLGRERFVERVWEWKASSGGQILGQMRRLGDSVDWKRERFTLDDGLSTAVREAFVRLYEQDLLYRGQRIINWCPRCLTALSDIEVEHEEVPGELAYLRYPLSDGSGRYVEVATSRAETMLGDTGVAVSPDDPRYADLVGKTVRLPLVDRDIPIVADEAVDTEFGTGAVKVTPAHDPNDWDIAQRTGLPAIEIFTPEAVVNHAGGGFEGLDRHAAREAVKQALAAQGLLAEVREAPHSVGHCYRCHTEIEPRLSMQWFVRTKPLAERSMEAVRSGETRIMPVRYEKEFYAWMENIRDWCVSRQIWWGHRIPAWYCQDGHVTVAREVPGACATCERPAAELRQDPDVLDTWFSSGLWPFSTMGWPERTPELDAYYPTSAIVTGYDILFFWIARMMMLGTQFMPQVPFRTIILHGMVRDASGRKESKSSGNALNPIVLMDRYGTDATRFALLRGANPGGDVPLTEELVEGGRNFANKVWNAARFVLSSLPAGVTIVELPAEATDAEEAGIPSLRAGGSGGAVQPPDQKGTAVGQGSRATNPLPLPDRWLLSRLERTRATVTAAYGDFDPAEAVRVLYAFTWSELADWAIELAKPRLSAGGEDAARAGAVLAYTLDTVVRLLHPVMPYLTDELGRALNGVDTITLGPWPAERPGDLDPAAEEGMAALQAAITAIRRFRAEHQVPPSRRPVVTIVPADERQAALFASEAERLARMARLERVEISAAAAPPAARAEPTAKLLAAGAELHLPLSGLLDLDAELARLRRERERLAGELARAEGKLANRAFVERAPAEVVRKSRDRAAELRSDLAETDEHIAELTG
jgi:valyl-tRNA synthetase